MLNNDCQNFIPMFQDYLDGTLDPAEKAELLKHLDVCDDCCVLFRELEQLSALLRAAPEVSVPPSTIPDAVGAMAAAARRNRTKRNQWVSVAAVLMVFAGSALAMNGDLIGSEKAKDRDLPNMESLADIQEEEVEYGAISTMDLPPDAAGGGAMPDSEKADTQQELRYSSCTADEGLDSFEEALLDPGFNKLLAENDLGYGYELIECVREEDGSLSFVIYFYEDARQAIEYNEEDAGWLSYSNVRSLNWKENE